MKVDWMGCLLVAGWVERKVDLMADRSADNSVVAKVGRKGSM
jgi:hypothetical protein